MTVLLTLAQRYAFLLLQLFAFSPTIIGLLSVKAFHVPSAWPLFGGKIAIYSLSFIRQPV
jgi:hypothetical protein